MVRRPSTSADSTTSRPALVGQPASAAPLQPLPPRHPRAEPSREATLQRHFRKSGFSGRAARVLSGCLRSSTSRLYQSRWQIFCGWCRGRGVAPVNATVPVVVDFLIHLRHDKGLSVSAVKDYSSALNSVLALKGRDLASSREISMMLCSFSRSVDPVELRPSAWDVALVLQSLTGAPYEPLQTCDERFLAQKTLFLLALASAKRIGELHTLSYRVSHTRNWGEVSFSFVPGFVAKTQDPSALAPRFEGFTVPALPNARNNRNGRLLCPVRAVRRYLDRTAAHRLQCEWFFVTAGCSKKEISKTTVSSWLRKTISRAYELSGMGSDLDKLAFTVLSRLSDLQSARGPQTPVQSQSMPSGLSQQAVILPNVSQPSVQSLSAGVPLVSRVLFCLMSVNLQFRQGVELVNRGLFCLMSANLFLLIMRLRGSPPPLHCLLTLPNQFSGSPRRPYLEGSSTKPLRALSPAMKGSRTCREHSPPLVRRLLHFALAAFVRFSLFWTLPHRLPRNCGMLGYRLHGLGFRRLPSLGRPKWVLLVLRRPEGVLRRPKGLLRRPKGLLIVQSRPQWVLVAQSSTLLSLVRLGDGLLTRLSVPRTTHLARGVILPPRKMRRHSGNSSDEDPASQNRQQRDDQQDEEDNFRPSSLDLLLNYITKKFPAASQPLAQPSSKRFHVMESAGLVDESSQQASSLAWFGHMRSACDSAQRKFEAKVSEGKSLSSILTAVSRTERVSDSPCQGRATKVNSQVFDLMSSRPAESRSVPLSVREATTLETALRGIMESYNFQLWTVTALFRFLGDSGCCPMDDPLLDQFQRSFSRGAENVAAALASTTAFVSAKRRESFLSHMFPSVTDAQKRKLLSDPLFDQKDLFAPASIEAAREAARDFSLYRGAQSRPSTSSGSNQRRQFSSSHSRGRHNSSPRSTSHRSPASSSSSSGRFQQKKKPSDPPRKREVFWR